MECRSWGSDSPRRRATNRVREDRRRTFRDLSRPSETLQGLGWELLSPDLVRNVPTSGGGPIA